MLVQNGVVLCQLNLEEMGVKGESVGHRFGACHKTSDAKVRMARIRITILGYQSR